jgi:hypothetical protein
MIKNLGILVLFYTSLLGVKAQDILLTLTGKEVPCVVNKVDTFFVFYSSLGPVQSIEKSLVKQITPQKLMLLDGTTMDVVFDRAAYDVKGPYIFYREKGKKELRKDRYNYFSCSIYSFDTLLPYQDSVALHCQEKILYAQDSLHKKFELNTEEQRAYTYGRRSARRNFGSPWSTMGGIAVGFAGGVILNFFYAAIPSLAYVSINAAIRPQVGVTSKEDEPYLNDELFIEGYRNQARLLKVKNSVLGTVPALAAGIVIRYFGTVN